LFGFLKGRGDRNQAPFCDGHEALRLLAANLTAMLSPTAQVRRRLSGQFGFIRVHGNVWQDLRVPVKNLVKEWFIAGEEHFIRLRHGRQCLNESFRLIVSFRAADNPSKRQRDVSPRVPLYDLLLQTFVGSSILGHLAFDFFVIRYHSVVPFSPTMSNAMDHQPQALPAPGGLVIPADRRYHREHLWILPRPDDPRHVRIGLTAYVCRYGIEVYFIENLSPPGTAVEPGDVIGRVETEKAAADLHSPLSGRVTALNEAVLADPSIITLDGYGQGWIMELEGEGGELLTAEEYVEWLRGLPPVGCYVGE
jgi:glycine cleavage system H protein